ncbi:TetR family transcriptional regulator [Modestobacter sp. I12A-02628]|uniref:TetR/AcrR family transcriptional regulator n=1 Tax=Goekera deserti TaxID=2497753 RepID=A0A7K3WBN1_9ACTN|nr:TetR/AcrR family transcriptional regulator [Goekera deserti]MPQ97410.1 TetR family transcriptional regulator [Goekera deserti]NDI47989.1 TetR family transcriptional regulator [Goekera deserti]NEL53737.1 TetR/AcrR family transcriptional regulator [Goekera deserti]
MPYRATAGTRRRADERRAALVRAAQTIVAEHGFAGARVTEIAQAAGTSAGSLYSYFSNRDELLAEVFRRAAAHELLVVRAAVSAAGEPAGRRLEALVRTFAGRALHGRQLAWSLLFEPVSTLVDAERLAFRQAYAGLGEDIVTAGIGQGVFRDQYVPLAATALMGAISEALVGRLRPVADESDAPSIEFLVREIGTFCAHALARTPPTTEESPR